MTARTRSAKCWTPWRSRLPRARSARSAWRLPRFCSVSRWRAVIAAARRCSSGISMVPDWLNSPATTAYRCPPPTGTCTRGSPCSRSTPPACPPRWSGPQQPDTPTSTWTAPSSAPTAWPLPAPNGSDLRWSGKHKHHGGNVQVISAPDGWPLWVSPVRPGREHDITCARTHGLIDALNRLAAALDLPTLTDLGYENAGPGFRHPVKKPQGGELTEHQQGVQQGHPGHTRCRRTRQRPAQGHLQGLAQSQPRPRRHHPHRPRGSRPAPARTRPHHLTGNHRPRRDVTEKGSVWCAAHRLAVTDREIATVIPAGNLNTPTGFRIYPSLVPWHTPAWHS